MICYVSACHFLSSATYSPSILTVPPLSLPTSIFLHRKRLSSNSLLQSWNCSHQLCLVGNLVKKTMMRERIKSKPLKNEDDLKALKRHKNVKKICSFSNLFWSEFRLEHAVECSLEREAKTTNHHH